MLICCVKQCLTCDCLVKDKEDSTVDENDDRMMTDRNELACFYLFRCPFHTLSEAYRNVIIGPSLKDPACRGAGSN
jgi:hypothetical protein